MSRGQFRFGLLKNLCFKIYWFTYGLIMCYHSHFRPFFSWIFLTFGLFIVPQNLHFFLIQFPGMTFYLCWPNSIYGLFKRDCLEAQLKYNLNSFSLSSIVYPTLWHILLSIVTILMFYFPWDTLDIFNVCIYVYIYI